MAIASLPQRERRLIGLYYFGEVTMKQIGAELGVNESRVSQLHARAIHRLRQALESSRAADRPTGRPVAMPPLLMQLVPASVGPRPVLAFEPRSTMLKAALPVAGLERPQPAAVLPYARSSRAVRSKSASLNGLASQRQPESSRKRSASVPTTSPVTKMTRRASAGLVAAMAR